MRHRGGTARVDPRLVLASAVAVLLLHGCSRPTASPKVAAEAGAYNSDIPLDEVMNHILNPAGYKFWGATGLVENKDGVHSLTPTTDEEWTEVENGAAMIVAGTDMIRLPAYAMEPRGRWNAYAEAVARLALQGKDAADKHDAGRVAALAEPLDKACDACHLEFDPTMKRPLTPPPAPAKPG